MLPFWYGGPTVGKDMYTGAGLMGPQSSKNKDRHRQEVFSVKFWKFTTFQLDHITEKQTIYPKFSIV